MIPVTLRTAYYWTCPHCGRDNFARPAAAQLDRDEKEEAFRHFHDLEPWQELPEGWEQFDLVEIPNEVQCGRCHGRFHPVDARGD